MADRNETPDILDSTRVPAYTTQETTLAAWAGGLVIDGVVAAASSAGGFWLARVATHYIDMSPAGESVTRGVLTLGVGCAVLAGARIRRVVNARRQYN